MKKFILFFMVFWAFPAYGQDMPSQLHQLRIDLDNARKKPWTKHQQQAKCPKNLEQFLGIPQDMLLAALGPADFIRGDTHTYFFVGKLPQGLRGGGFPELQFKFNSSKQIQEVNCHYSR